PARRRPLLDRLLDGGVLRLRHAPSRLRARATASALRPGCCRAPALRSQGRHGDADARARNGRRSGTGTLSRRGAREEVAFGGTPWARIPGISARKRRSPATRAGLLLFSVALATRAAQLIHAARGSSDSVQRVVPTA